MGARVAGTLRELPGCVARPPNGARDRPESARLHQPGRGGGQWLVMPHAAVVPATTGDPTRQALADGHRAVTAEAVRPLPFLDGDRQSSALGITLHRATCCAARTARPHATTRSAAAAPLHPDGSSPA